MKGFRIPREPALWVGLLGSALSVAAAVGVPHVTAGVAAAGTVFIAAAVMAVFTRPIAPALYVGAFSALAAVVTEFGFHPKDVVVGAVSALIMGTFAFFGVRPQVDPTNASGKVIEGEIVSGATVPR